MQQNISEHKHILLSFNIVAFCAVLKKNYCSCKNKTTSSYYFHICNIEIIFDEHSTRTK